jgi:ankyrin repeat protein
VPATAHAQALDTARFREAATRGYAAIQTAQRVSRKSQSCTTTCHLQGYGAFSYRSVREHGVALDEAAVRADLNRGLREPVADLARAVQGNTLGEVAMNAAFFMVASHAAGLPPGIVTATFARAVAMQQNPEGDWTALYTRPPSNSSRFTFTAMGLRTLQLYGHASQKADMGARVKRAAAWLQSHAPMDTEDRSYQLIGSWWAGADRAILARMARRLVATQREDGGWNSIEGGASNAYATGEALVALHDAGGIPTTDAAWRRGAEFLIRAQAADGTWRVPTRLPPFISPPYFESGYPYGRDQFISVAGANWSVMALTRALGEPVAARDLALSDTTAPDIEPWVETAMFGTVAELRGLLDSGLSPDATTAKDKLSLLMLVVPDVAKTKLLLDRGANVNQRSAWKYSALLVAAQYRDSTDAIRLLLDRGAEVRAPAALGTVTASAYPLFFAAHVGNTAAVQLLRKAGDDLDASAILFGSSLFTPITAAATFGHLDTVRALLDLKANTEGNGRGQTPLQAAVSGHHLELVRLLIERGADVNHGDATGRTPLHYAASVDFGDTAIAELLLKAGAKADVPDKEGVTAQQMAEKGNARVLARLARR